MKKLKREDAALDMLRAFHGNRCWAGDELTFREIVDYLRWPPARMDAYTYAMRTGWFVACDRDVGLVLQLSQEGAKQMAQHFGWPRKEAIINPVDRFAEEAGFAPR